MDANNSSRLQTGKRQARHEFMYAMTQTKPGISKLIGCWVSHFTIE